MIKWYSVLPNKNSTEQIRRGYKIQSGTTLSNKAVRAKQLFLHSVPEQQLMANHETNHYLLFCAASQKSTQRSVYDNSCNDQLFNVRNNIRPILTVSANRPTSRNCIPRHHHRKSALSRFEAIWWMQSNPPSAHVDSEIQCTIQCTPLQAKLQTLSRSS